MSIVKKWRQATEEEIAQGLDSPQNAGMILVEEIEVEQTIAYGLDGETFDLTTIEGYKNYIVDLFDRRSREQIAQGFEFENIVFSMSDNAQKNLQGLPDSLDEDFPMPYLGKNDEYFVLTNNSHALQLHRTAFLFRKNILVNNGGFKIYAKTQLNTLEELKLFKQNNNL